MAQRVHTVLFPHLEEAIQNISTLPISEVRKGQLAPLANYLKEKRTKSQQVNLLFICTHNSRRSHLSQVWAQALSAWCGFENLSCYSGGTETTAMYPAVAKTLENDGFSVLKLSAHPNPIYGIKYGEAAHPVVAFSKEFAHGFNPSTHFAAVMTCSHADANCPFVPGAEERFSVPFDDPKQYDGTAREAEMYLARSRQIASEFLYVFNQATAP